MKFHKTNHFINRQRDRNIDDAIVSKITSKIKEISKSKSIIIASKNLLKKIGMNTKVKKNLILISQGKVLITAFYINDIYAYLSSLHGKIETIIV